MQANKGQGMRYETEFETTIRGVPVYIEAYALGDESGIYRTGFTAYVDGADVTGLLTDDDIAQVESETMQALENDASDVRDQSRFEREHSARALG